VSRRAAPEPPQAGREALVLTIGAGRCLALPDGAHTPVECRLPGRVARRQRTLLAVGDRVLLGEGRDGERRLVEVLPRRSHLSRRGAERRGRHQRRVVAANVDVALIVVTAREPALRTGLVDRYLVALETGGVRPVIALNKVDLLDAREREAVAAALAPYAALGIERVECSAVGPPGVTALRDALRDRLAVLVGQSGVGKSSLLNALHPALRIATRPVGRDTAKGRHTTTASTLYRLEGDIRVIDTPGIRELALWEVSAEDVRAAFHDFDAAAPGCRFANCTHVHEPDCAVRRAVAEGTIAEARHESYRRLLESLPD